MGLQGETEQSLAAKSQIPKVGLDKIADCCLLEKNVPMPGPLLFRKHSCSPTSVNKEQTNTL